MSRKDGGALQKPTPWVAISTQRRNRAKGGVLLQRLNSSQRLIELNTDALRFDAHNFTLDVDRIFDAG